MRWQPVGPSTERSASAGVGRARASTAPRRRQAAARWAGTLLRARAAASCSVYPASAPPLQRRPALRRDGVCLA